MGIKNFKVELEKVHRCFFPGEAVVGRVILDVKKKMEIQGLCVSFVGKATVMWSDSGSGYKTTGNRSKKTNGQAATCYRDVESYFKTDLILAGQNGANNGNRRKVVIPSGKSIFPFSFTLPHGIPSSYVGKAGQVYYCMEVILYFGKSSINHRFPFTVNGILDLNYEPSSTQALDYRKYKSVGCLWWQSGPVGFILKVDKKGYVPGEPIRFAVEISNLSTRKITGITFALVQVVSFHAKGNTFTDKRTIRKVEGPEIGKGDTELWDNDFLQIPPLPPTRLANCRIIDLQYFLTINMEVGKLSGSIQGELPIIIGTIPLRSTFQNFRAPRPTQPPAVVDQEITGSQAGASAPIESETPLRASAPVLDEYPDLPPPSYEEAMTFETGKIVTSLAYKSGKRGNDGGETVADKTTDYQVNDTFSPRYITYIWDQMP